jgi:hypothetical protein
VKPAFTITFGIICNTSQQAELTFEAGSGGFVGYGSVSIGDILPRLVLPGDLVLGDRFPKKSQGDQKNWQAGSN